MSSMLLWNHNLQKNDVWQVPTYKTKAAKQFAASLAFGRIISGSDITRKR